MQSPSKRFAILVVAVVGVALLPWMSPQAASTKVPPTIDEMTGIWQMKVKDTVYDLSTGEKENFNEEAYWEITKVDDTTLNMRVAGGDPADPGISLHYRNGILFATRADDDTFATEGMVILAVVSGSGGKLKAKGDALMGDVPENGAGKMKFTLKRVSDLPL